MESKFAISIFVILLATFYIGGVVADDHPTDKPLAPTAKIPLAPTAPILGPVVVGAKGGDAHDDHPTDKPILGVRGNQTEKGACKIDGKKCGKNFPSTIRCCGWCNFQEEICEGVNDKKGAHAQQGDLSGEPECQEVQMPCLEWTDCCTGACYVGKCVIAKASRRRSGQSGQSGKSGAAGRRAGGCLADRELCLRNAECCSKKCYGGRCARIRPPWE